MSAPSVAMQRFDAALQVTGNENGHVAWWLANNVPWESDAHMADFLQTLAGPDPSSG